MINDSNNYEKIKIKTVIVFGLSGRFILRIINAQSLDNYLSKRSDD